MAITAQQVPGAQQTLSQLSRTIGDLQNLLGQARALIDKNWQIDIGTTAPLIVTVSADMQNQLVAQYDGLKASLVTTFQQLP